MIGRIILDLTNLHVGIAIMETPKNTSKPVQKKKIYTPPKLDILGDVRDITLGGSPGRGDSGSATTKFPK
jgi:hypothetical protein